MKIIFYRRLSSHHITSWMESKITSVVAGETAHMSEQYSCSIRLVVDKYFVGLKGNTSFLTENEVIGEMDVMFVQFQVIFEG